jgi:hypothetical protein
MYQYRAQQDQSGAEHPASTGSAIPTILVLNHCAGQLRGLMDSNQPQLKEQPRSAGTVRNVSVLFHFHVR